jgi:Fic family protein
MRLPQNPPNIWPILFELFKNRLEAVAHAAPALPDGRYLHWDELRRREPPEGLNVQEWWATVKWARVQKRIPIHAMKAAYSRDLGSSLDFGVVQLPSIQAELHEFDRKNVGKELLTALGNQDALTEYRVSQLIEEAINSSVLEGAKPTTRELARQLVREERTPATRDERMILNNWYAMRRILELRDENRPLVVDDVLELHRILGEGALDVPDADGKFRQPCHTVVVQDVEGNIWHTPPPAEGIRGRIESLLQFAESGALDGSGAFVHPVLRAIIVHFWVGYEHPFRDGNGRIARALFYWCMLRHGYEIAEFLSISGPIDKSPQAYYAAFAHTETDDGDLTYFVLHQLKVMRQALADLMRHLTERAASMAELARRVAGFDTLNHRQRALLQHALRHPLGSYTIEGHAASHRVHYQTARSDIVELLDNGYLVGRRVGRGKRYFPTDSLGKRLKE